MELSVHLQFVYRSTNKLLHITHFSFMFQNIWKQYGKLSDWFLYAHKGALEEHHLLCGCLLWTVMRTSYLVWWFGSPREKVPRESGAQSAAVGLFILNRGAECCLKIAQSFKCYNRWCIFRSHWTWRTCSGVAAGMWPDVVSWVRAF